MQIRFLAFLALGLSTPAFAAAPASVQLNFKPGTQSVELYGEKSETLYREESYETTCYRDEYQTAYREVCDHREVQSCSSHPVCRDVNRPVCDSNGCTDYPTRECTTEESCSSHTETYNCRDEAYTVTVSVPYSCTQTHLVPYGTQLTDRIRANVTVHFTGELAQESAGESFGLAVANGLDTSAPDFRIVSDKTSNDYLFVLREISPAQIARTGIDVSIRREFEIHSFSVARIVAENSLKMTRMHIDRKGIDVDLEATRTDSLNFDLTVQRDRVIGSHVTIYKQRLPQEAVTIAQEGTLSKVRIDFAKLGGIGINGRPHRYGLVISLDWKAATSTGDLLNQGAADRISAALKTSKVIRASL